MVETLPLSPKTNMSFKLMLLSNHGHVVVDDGASYMPSSDLAKALSAGKEAEKFSHTFDVLAKARRAYVYDDGRRRVAAISVAED